MRKACILPRLSREVRNKKTQNYICEMSGEVKNKEDGSNKDEANYGGH